MTTVTPASADRTDPTALVPARTAGWAGGLGNLVRKELGQWFTTRMWWIQVLVWVVILNGITTVVMLDSAGMSPGEVVGEAVQTFLLVAATSIGIGVVLTVQGAVVGEKEMGTAAWVMSKPVSRFSFVAAKLIGHAAGFLVTALLLPSAVFLVEARLLLDAPIAYGPFTLAVAVLALSVVFYVVLTVALGTLFRTRGPVAGIGIGLILVGQFFKGMLPLPLVLVTPWLLGDVAGSLALQTVPDWDRSVPVITTLVAAVLLAVLAGWRFDREEF